MSHRITHILLFLIGCLALLTVQGCTPSEHDAVVATVGTKEIRLSEYKEAYNRNNAGKDSSSSSTAEDREKLLDLLVKFHLKLLDAYRQGLDKTPEFQNEINQYKGTLASSYLTEREVVQPGLQRLYKRRSEEIRASHILLSLSSKASPADSAAAAKKAYELIAELKKGASFDSLAVANSQDPSVKQNHGDLYYFTGGEMVAPFEDAAFALKPGEFSLTPVRTQFGLHILKVTDRRPSPGQIRCSHIMIRFSTQNPTPEDTLKAYKKTLAIRDSLAQGADFAELAKRNSDDPGSAPNGGDLGWFSRRRWVLPFDEAAFTLKAGQVSSIVRTPYGYHLIKCTGVKPPPTFDEAKDDLKRMYQRSYYDQDYGKYLATLKKELHFVQNDSVMSLLLTVVDSSRNHPDTTWTSFVPASLGRATLLTIAAKPVSVDSVVVLLKGRSELPARPIRQTVVNVMEKVVENLLFENKADALQRTDPEYASLMKQYSEGLLLYQIEQNQVWNRVSNSDSSLHAFYAAHRDQYVFPDRVNFTEITAVNAGAAQVVEAMLKEGKTFDRILKEDSERMQSPHSFTVQFPRKSSTLNKTAKETLQAIAAQMKLDAGIIVESTVHPDTARDNRRDSTLQSKRQEAIAQFLNSLVSAADKRVVKKASPLPPARTGKAVQDNAAAGSRVEIELTHRIPLVRGKVDTLVLAVSADERAKHADSLAVGAFSAPFKNGDGFVIVRLNRREPARQKTFEEAASEVSSAFQEWDAKRLEGEWMKELRAEYPVVEHKEVLDHAFLTSK